MGRRIKTVTRDEMKRLDCLAQKKYGIPALILMENAGLRAADIAWGMLKRERKPRVGIFCGHGNNGGDGLVAARHLWNHGAKICVYIISRQAKISPEAQLNLDILLKMGHDVKIISREFDAGIIRNRFSLIIDALFGINFRGEVKEPFYSVISYINHTKIPILALDIPSGIDADSGRAANIAVKAARTVTFGYAKKGMFLAEGKKYSGKVIVADIGLQKKTP